MTEQKTHYESTIHGASDSQDFPAATLKDFVRFHINKGSDYATTYARACSPYGEIAQFDALFDQEWDKQGGL